MNPNRHVPRNKFKPDEVRTIQELTMQGLDKKAIALHFFQRKPGLDMQRLTRQIAVHVRQFERGQINVWVPDEDEMVQNLYLNGITKESIIAKYLPKKCPWMVRDRIRYLKTKKKIFDNQINDNAPSIKEQIYPIEDGIPSNTGNETIIPIFNDKMPYSNTQQIMHKRQDEKESYTQKSTYQSQELQEDIFSTGNDNDVLIWDEVFEFSLN